MSTIKPVSLAQNNSQYKKSTVARKAYPIIGAVPLAIVGYNVAARRFKQPSTPPKKFIANIGMIVAIGTAAALIQNAIGFSNTGNKTDKTRMAQADGEAVQATKHVNLGA